MPCAGPDLHTTDFQARHGLTDAAAPSQMLNAAEDGLGAELVTLYSGFKGVADMAHAAHN